MLVVSAERIFQRCSEATTPLAITLKTSCMIILLKSFTFLFYSLANAKKIL